MSLVSEDIDNIIVSLLFSPNYKSSLKRLKKIYYSFARSSFPRFVSKCRDICFRNHFIVNDVPENDIDGLIKKAIKRGTPRFFPTYATFTKNLGAKELNFEDLKRTNVLLINYLSLYHGYMYIYTGNQIHDHFGYSYYNFHDKACNVGGIFTYRQLKIKKVHNLKYYDLVEDSDNRYERKYKLKEDACIYKIGTSYEMKSMTCIKIL